MSLFLESAATLGKSFRVINMDIPARDKNTPTNCKISEISLSTLPITIKNRTNSSNSEKISSLGFIMSPEISTSN